MSDNRNVLELRGVSKRYGQVLAVGDVSFVVRVNETFGLIGHNGAGKTTTLEVVCGLLRPDRGDVIVAGHDVAKNTRDAQRAIGYSPQSISIFPLLSPRENLEFVARAQGVGRTLRPSRVASTLSQFALTEIADRPCSTLSGGEQRLVQIAMAAIHEPVLLVLDEPTVGVDVVTRRVIQDWIRSASVNGSAVLYTTHYLEEAQAVCDVVGVLKSGSPCSLSIRQRPL